MLKKAREKLGSFIDGLRGKDVHEEKALSEAMSLGTEIQFRGGQLKVGQYFTFEELIELCEGTLRHATPQGGYSINSPASGGTYFTITDYLYDDLQYNYGKQPNRTPFSLFHSTDVMLVFKQLCSSKSLEGAIFVFHEFINNREKNANGIEDQNPLPQIEEYYDGEREIVDADFVDITDKKLDVDRNE